MLNVPLIVIAVKVEAWFAAARPVVPVTGMSNWPCVTFLFTADPMIASW